MNLKIVYGFQHVFKVIAFKKLTKIALGAFNNYVYRMRGEGVKKFLFLSTLKV